MNTNAYRKTFFLNSRVQKLEKHNNPFAGYISVKKTLLFIVTILELGCTLNLH